MAKRKRPDENALYVISIAAELAGVHPQTLRVYERKGLVNPQRTQGNTRRYSEEDIDRLRKIQRLTHEGVNLAGVMKIIDIESDLLELERRYEAALEEVERTKRQIQEALDARDRNSMVPFRDVRRVRRAMKADFIDRAGTRRTFIVPPAE